MNEYMVNIDNKIDYHHSETDRYTVSQIIEENHYKGLSKIFNQLSELTIGMTVTATIENNAILSYRVTNDCEDPIIREKINALIRSVL